MESRAKDETRLFTTAVADFSTSHSGPDAARKPDVALLVMKLSNHRVAATVVMGLLGGSYIHHMYMTWNRRGKDAFISHELQRFDRFMAHPHTLIFTLAYGIIAAAVIFAFPVMLILLATTDRLHNRTTLSMILHLGL